MIPELTSKLFRCARAGHALAGSPPIRGAAGFSVPPAEPAETTAKTYEYKLTMLDGNRHDYKVRLEKRVVVISGRIRGKDTNYERRHLLPESADLRTVRAAVDRAGVVTVTTAIRE